MQFVIYAATILPRHVIKIENKTRQSIEIFITNRITLNYSSLVKQ